MHRRPGEELDELIYLEDDATFYGRGGARANVELFELLGGHVGIDACSTSCAAGSTTATCRGSRPCATARGCTFRHDRLSARVGFLRHRKQRRNADFETETGAYTSWDAQVTVRLLSGGARARPLGCRQQPVERARPQRRQHPARTKCRCRAA